MRVATLRHLVLKDWHLHRVPVALTVVGSVVAVVLLMLPGAASAGLGVNLALAVLITLTFYLPLSTVLEERGKGTITFLMSLPISSGEYVASKILSNLTLYLLPWLTIVVGIRLVAARAGLPVARSGWVPVVLLGMVAGFCLVLAFALITESGGWTVALTIFLLFLFGNVLTQILPEVPEVARVMRSIDARGTAFGAALAVESVLIVALLGSCFLIQSRKRDFL